MFVHSNFPSGAIGGLDWQRPVLPDDGPTFDRAESPITRRLLHDLQLAPDDRLLATGTRDPQFVELAAAEVGGRGHITIVEPDPDRLHRTRRRTAHLREVIHVLPELPRLTGERYHAVAVVDRDGAVPDARALRPLTDRLHPGGRLALVAFEAPAGRVASSAILRSSPRAGAFGGRDVTTPGR